MNKTDYDEELRIIKHIANKNGYKPNLVDKINHRVKMKQQQRIMTTLTLEDNNKNSKYISIEYNKATSNIIQKTLNKLGYKTAYKTTNKIEQKLKYTKHKPPNDTGVYRINCNDCNKFYVGQTGRSFEKRFKEHISDIQKTEPKSNFAQHIKSEKHTYTDYNSNLTILHRIRKGQTLNRLEELEIYKNRNNNNLLNDKINTKTNKIYDRIICNS